MNVHDSASGKADATKTATLTYNGKQITLPVRSGSIGPYVIERHAPLPRDGLLYVRPRLHVDSQLLARRSRTSMARRAFCFIGA